MNPGARIRLAAGRMQLSKETQALAFFAGANSIFIGNKLLTTPNAEASDDDLLLTALSAQDGATSGNGFEANSEG
jgi:biotin synthase